MAERVTLEARGDRVYAVVPEDYAEPISSVTSFLRQELPGMKVDWTAVREAYKYARGRPFPIATRQQEAPRDEKARVRFSADRLTAYLLLYPPKPKGKKLEEAELVSLIASYGIPNELLDRQALRMAFLRRSYREPEPIANGRPPVNGEPSRVEWRRGLPTDPEGFIHAMAERDDFPENILGEVGEGETAGILHPPGTGQPGLAANGETIPAAAGADTLELGEGLGSAPDGRTVVALKAGHLRLRGERGTHAQLLPLLHVQDAQELRPWSEEVFPGSVIVEGDLEVPFPLRVLGDLEVRGGVFRSSMDIMGSLFVRDGIIQHRGSPSRVGGILSAGFLERAWVQAHTIYVRRYSLKSQFLALDSVLAPPTGNIRGGKAAAGRFFAVGSLGTSGSMPMTVTAGQSGTASTFAETYREWALMLEAEGSSNMPARSERRAAAEELLQATDTLEDTEPKDATIHAHEVFPAVTVRMGSAIRKIESTVGPVDFSFEMLGPRGRVAMSRR